MSDAPPPPVAVGSLLAGKYRIDRVLGQGGMGVVVAATHIHLEQRVAIKFLLGQAAQNAEAVARFTREARAATKILSEHVVRVSDVGTLDDGAPYMVMEYLDGCDLSQLLERRGPLPVGEALDYVLQACEALAEAHVAGIVHRDLKPANLYLTQRADGSPIVKVLDFGISKITVKGSNEAAMTKTSALMGSPLYMSPEQMRSTRGVDARSDIWSLGIIVFELLSGQAAFQAETMPELCARILAEPPPALRSVRPDAPLAVESAIARCLEKDPAKRFQNVGELAQALAESAPAHARLSVDRVTRVMLGSGAQVSLPAVSDGQVRPPSAPDGALGVPHTVTSFGGTGSAVKRAKGPIVMLALGGAVAVGLVIALAARGSSHSADRAARIGVASSPAPAATPAPAASPAATPAPAASPAATPAPAATLAPAASPAPAPVVPRRHVAPLAAKQKAASPATDPGSDFGDRK